MFNKYEEAMVLQKELAESPVPYAKIKVFYQGQPLALSKLKMMAKGCPDLVKYLAGQE